MDPAAAAAATPPSTGKAKPRARRPEADKAAAGDASPGGDKAGGAGAGPATPGPAAAGGSGAGGKAAAEGLSPAGGVTKKRARPAKPKAPVEAAAAAGEDFGGEEPPQPVLQDTSMPYRGTFTKDHLLSLMVDVDQLQKVVEAGGAEEAGGEEGGGEEVLGEELPDNAAVEDLE
ncbi:hypothetical protein HYH03_018001 [Edaphochlamys debaryana]|uniref:Uncharacterized protein n=1 Tax=Edaphochlamys debaryana TaxID=47281 RepID=A0A835XL99_9CHLO|nr:hypothetical protein HYH03_018001 [Edaphochlamys debaryana]|eukprot:KAG2483110.1 hypothetical protein HYH03_018001 [Edaphochlamys debaryana]